MIRSFKHATVLLSLALLAACSQYGKPETLAANQITLSGKVVALDTASRQLTVQDATGNQTQIQADDKVRNFDQIHVGDVLEIDYLDAVTVALEPAGSEAPGAYRQQDEATAKPGQKPGMGSSDVVTIVAPVQGVDTVNHTLTVKGPEGNLVRLDVKQPDHQANLGKVKIGDLLRISFAQATAVAIRPKG